MAMPARIDVHQHIVPPFWAELRARAGADASGGWAVPSWSKAAAIDMMDDLGIAAGILSPGAITFGDAKAAADARRCNEFTAGVMRDRPDRFGTFAALPLPNIDASISEMTYAFDELHADGVVLFANYRGTYLGDPSFAPIWDELDRRGAVVFIHPAQPPLPWLPGIPGPVVDFPLDTARAAMQLVVSGTMKRCTRVRVILAHGGGFLPYAAHRFAELANEAIDPARSVEDYLADMRLFLFDTALCAGPAAMPSLLAFAAPGNILFGSDFPFASRPVGTSFTRKLDAYVASDAALATSINRGAALNLFPRLA